MTDIYKAIKALTGSYWGDLRQTLGIAQPTLSRRLVSNSPLSHLELVKIKQRWSLDWQTLGMIMEHCAQALDNKGDLLHENYRTRAPRRGKGKGKGTRKAGRGSK